MDLRSKQTLGQYFFQSVSYRVLGDIIVNTSHMEMFEYMSAGLPVIAPNSPLWRNILEDNECGVCVSLVPKEIVSAIQYLIDNPAIAQQVGERGRKAVEEKYNWVIEEQKLFVLYEEPSVIDVIFCGHE